MRYLFDKLLSWYFTKNSLPYWCIFLLDTLILFLSGVFSYWAFQKTGALIENHVSVLLTALIYTVFGMVFFRLFRTYSGIVRYSSFIDLTHVSNGNLCAMTLALCYSWLMELLQWDAVSIMSQTEIVIAFIIATILMWSMRVLVKTLYDVAFSDKRAMRVLIYGALSGGIGLAKNINSQHPRRFVLRGFISHDERSHHIQLMGRRVYNVNDDLAAIIEKENIQAVIVSPMRAKEFRKNDALQDLFIKAGCKIFMASQAKEYDENDKSLTDDEIQHMQFSEVQVEDLLPRQEIKVDMASVGELLKGRRVLITGSAGSIGSEMVRQIAYYKPAKMMLIDQAETPQHDIRLMMAKDFPDVEAETVVTSISRQTRMDTIFSTFRPDYVFHAAAYKHVPMMEDNPSEAVLNNIWGTKIIADMSVKYGVKKFVMVSTDKAVNPTNVMGCSKRICEIYCQSLNQSEANTNHTQFVTTRFGNVLGSNGSVIPLFREQIKNGGPVTVTDERIVRFFMLIPEACKLVLEAGTKGHGGEIFVFDMGQPVKIADLAKRMIALSGAKNVKIEFTGLRAGEKLYEEVLNEMEGTKPSFHEKIRIAEVREYDYQQVSKEIDDLIAISKKYDDMATVAKMKAIVPEYKSNNSIYEKLDK
jgi:FlaA1/EpsC-like NDP-sugar epimerase